MTTIKTKVPPPTEHLIFTGKDGREYKLTFKEKLFVEKYLEAYANGTEAMMQVYDVKNRKVAAAMAAEYLRKPNIYSYVNYLMEEYGYNDDNVEKQHLFLLNQASDLKSKAKAVEMFHKLRKKYGDDGEKGVKIIIEVPEYGKGNQDQGAVSVRAEAVPAADTAKPVAESHTGDAPKGGENENDPQPANTEDGASGEQEGTVSILIPAIQPSEEGNLAGPGDDAALPASVDREEER